MKHLDEGTIHAWLDGEPRRDADEIERHVAACAECAARVAEARGLIAGSSRILSALDDVGSGIVPGGGSGGGETIEFKAVGIRPMRILGWLAAAGLVVAVGVKTVGNSRTVGTAVTATTTPTATAPAAPAKPVAKAPAAVVNEPAKPEAGKVAAAKVETTKVAAMPKALGAAGGAVSAKSAMAADAMTARRDSGMAGAAAMAAAAAPTAKGLSLQNVVVTGVSEQRRAASAEVTATTAAELGRVPVCFDSYQSAAEFTGAAANAVKTRFAPAPLMLDTTPASFGTNAMADQPAGGAFRQLRDSAGVVGSWARLAPDSIELRIGGRSMLGLVTGAGLNVEGRMLARRECGVVRR